MTERRSHTALVTMREWWERAHLNLRALFVRTVQPDHVRLLRCSPARRLVKVAAVCGGVFVVGALACGGLWWRLGSGPMSLDMATPWLTSALEAKFGPGHHVEVGGTVLERDEEGRTALRLRDIVVRDTNGTIVASAPKAELGLSGLSLFTGSPRAERISLIGAEMALRIEPNGQLTIFAAGLGDRPIASVAAAGAPAGPVTPTPASPSSSAAEQSPTPNLFAVLAGWLHSLEQVGLDGGDLAEVGLKSGSLAIDDERTGKRLRFENINLSLSRLKDGGAALAVTSHGADGPWSLSATVTPRGDGRRMIEAVVRDLSPKDILVALRLGHAGFQADVPISAVLRAELGPDGMPLALDGRIVGGAGYIGDPADRKSRLLVDEVQAELRWDPENKILTVPVEAHAAANRFAVMVQVEPPRAPGGVWSFAVANGTAMLASSDKRADPPMILDRLAIRATFDPVRQRLTLEQADLRGAAGGLNASGTLDLQGEDSRIAVGMAATRMGLYGLKRLWPAFLSPEVRDWVMANLHGGTVERIVVATNMRTSSLRPDIPLAPDDALTIEIDTKGTSVRAIDGLPSILDADLVVRVNGRRSTVALAKGRVELPSGRRLTLTDGMFEVGDTAVMPVLSQTRFRVEGPMEAVGELLAMEPVREAAAATPFDMSTAKGAVVGQMLLGLPLQKSAGKRAITYAIEADVTGFAAEKFWRGQRAEASALRVAATHDSMVVKGDIRLAGVPAVIEYRKLRSAAEAELRLQATLDDNGRNRLGLDPGNNIAGPMPVRLNGRFRTADREFRDGRFQVEADLTQTRITDLVPGWVKAPGRSARVSFVMVDRGQSMRLEDFVLDGGGATVRGTLEVDSEGELISANLPTFSLSDGDKGSLKADRTSDGALRLTLRGDVFDGRGLVKSSVSGQKADPRARRNQDVDLDIKVGAMTGYHGEALRSLELKMSRRGGHIRSFTMNGRLGRDARIVGDLRMRGTNRQVMYLETTDAGALFRFTDIYPRIIGGAVSIAMDPPVSDNSPREGLINLRDFTVRGERVLEQVASNSADPNNPGARNQNNGVGFQGLRAEFTRSPGRFAIRDGVVWGQTIGATVEGHLDYGRDEARLRGTFVPAYALNNLFSRVPVLGAFLGGRENEGLLGVTYQVVGRPGAPVLQVNPMSVIAPGIFREMFKFRNAEDVRNPTPNESMR